MSDARVLDRIRQTIGDRDLGNARLEHLDRLASRMAAAHWHVNDLPWHELPALPMPAVVGPKRRRTFIELGMRAVNVQLAAEHVAVIAAHALLLHAQQRRMHPAVCRALAAVLNDEASHVGVMIELQVRAYQAYPDIDIGPSQSPLLAAFADAIPRLHPAAVALFMGAYEAMIAIRSYAEEAAYALPSILGRVASLAARDDGHHAKVMRLVAHELLDDLRNSALDAASFSATVRSQILDPIREFWPLAVDHEYFLLHRDPRFCAEWKRRVRGDIAILERMCSVMGFSDDDLAYLDLLGSAARLGA